MPSHNGEVPLLKRAAILTLHWHGEKNWTEISALLKVNPEKARAICARAKVPIKAKISPHLERSFRLTGSVRQERATNPDDFDDVLRHLENLELSQNKGQHMDQHHDQRPAGVENRILNRAIGPSEPKGPRILERPGQHEGQSKDQHRVSRPNTVQHKNPNVTNPLMESKALGMLEEDLSLTETGFVNCFGSLEGVTMMRDMDWR